MQMVGAGSISGLVQVRQQLFSRLDGDADGQVSLDEFRSGAAAAAQDPASVAGARVEDLFAAIDGNGDGSLTRAELDRALGNPLPGMRDALLRLQDHETDAAISAGSASSAGSDLPSTVVSAIQSYLTAGLKSVVQVAGTALSLAV